MDTNMILQNLKCSGCATSITKELLKIKGVQDVRIETNTASITIGHVKDLGLEVLEKELLRLGYPKKNTKNSLRTKAKSFVSCGRGRLSTN